MERGANMGNGLQVGDKVRVLILEDEDKTGTIVGEGDVPRVTMRKLDPDPRLRGPEEVLSWWKVRLDDTGEEQDFPDDRLTKYE